MASYFIIVLMAVAGTAVLQRQRLIYRSPVRTPDEMEIDEMSKVLEKAIELLNETARDCDEMKTRIENLEQQNDVLRKRVAELDGKVTRAIS